MIKVLQINQPFSTVSCGSSIDMLSDKDCGVNYVFLQYHIFLLVDWSQPSFGSEHRSLLSACHFLTWCIKSSDSPWKLAITVDCPWIYSTFPCIWWILLTSFPLLHQMIGTVVMYFGNSHNWSRFPGLTGKIYIYFLLCSISQLTWRISPGELWSGRHLKHIRMKCYRNTLRRWDTAIKKRPG